jgi:hypothetical protein
VERKTSKRARERVTERVTERDRERKREREKERENSLHTNGQREERASDMEREHIVTAEGKDLQEIKTERKKE